MYYSWENDHVMKPFDNSLFLSISSDAYLVDNISLRLNFQRVYSVGENQCYYTCLITCMCVEPLIRIFSPMGSALRMLCWLTFWLLQVFRTFKDDFILSVFYM